MLLKNFAWWNANCLFTLFRPSYLQAPSDGIHRVPVRTAERLNGAIFFVVMMN